MGCWASGLAVISLMDLAGKIKYVVDSATFKQGKYTPATHVPIVSPDALDSDPVDAIIVMAASYSDEVARIIRQKFDKNINIAILRDFGLKGFNMILINSSPKDALKIFQPFLPISVPIGIGFLSSALQKEGINAYIVDEQVDFDPVATVHEYVKKISKPYIFGFSVLTATYKSAVILSNQLKSYYPESVIVFGGIHPTAMPDEVLSNNSVDFVIRGEGEKALVKLYNRIKNNESFGDIKSLSYKQNGEIVHNERDYLIEDLDSYPGFPYHLFTNRKYDLGFVLSSRGCPYNCIFCSNRITTGRKYRYRNAETIADEILMLNTKYDKKHVGFYDDNFLVNKKRVYDLIEASCQKSTY